MGYAQKQKEAGVVKKEKMTAEEVDEKRKIYYAEIIYQKKTAKINKNNDE